MPFKSFTEDCDGESKDVEVMEASSEDAGAWTDFLEQRPEAGHYFSWPWGEIITSSFGHRRRNLIARRGQRVVGILPLAEVRSLLVGHALISMPYLNGGGTLAVDERAAKALLIHMGSLRNTISANYAELRYRENLPTVVATWPSNRLKVAMLLSLEKDPERLFSSLPSKLRSQIRRPAKAGATIRSCTGADCPEEEIEGFYHVFSINMRDLGTPVYPRRLFTDTLNAFGVRSRLITVWFGERCAAGAITVGAGDLVEIPWASSSRRDNHLAPNMLLYWEAIRGACADGYRTFDFGRSTPGSGTYRFKQQWGASPIPLTWHYSLGPGRMMPDLNPQSPRYRTVTNLWRRLPLPLTRLAGPWLTRSLP